MLIRCTHCHHELRVPDHQISETGTRVLCRSCNTIFVARRPAEDSRGAQIKTAQDQSTLSGGDDPALEEALDRILDRSPLAAAVGPGGANEIPADASDDVFASPPARGSERPSEPSWSGVPPEDLGFSLVDENAPPPPPGRLRDAPAKPASAPRKQAAQPSDTGGDDVDDLLDQVLRDLDRGAGEAPPGRRHAASSAPTSNAGDPGASHTLNGLGFDESEDQTLEDAFESSFRAAPTITIGAGPTETTNTSLDLESILQELDADPAPPAARPSRPAWNRDSAPQVGDSFPSSAFEEETGAPTIPIGLGDDLSLGDTAPPPRRAPAPAPPAQESGAHERERSLEEMFADDDQGIHATDALAPAPRPMIPPAEPPAAPRAKSPSGEMRAKRTPVQVARPASRRSSSVPLLLVVLALLAGGGGYWYWTQLRPGTTPTATGTNAPAGLPSFAFEESDGELVRLKTNLAFAVHGRVRNTSAFPVYVVKVSGILKTSDGREVARVSSYAGNTVPTANVSTTPRGEVESLLGTAIGEGGMNVKVEAGDALPFTLIFYDVPSDVGMPTLSATARTFPAPPSGNG